MKSVAARGRALHLMGLVSDGGVHSQLTHLFALLEMARDKGLSKVFVHAILDGRDTPPDSGVGYLKQLQDHIRTIDNGAIASVCGRYYRHGPRQALGSGGKGLPAIHRRPWPWETEPVAAVQKAYGRGETDEFIEPVVMVQEDGMPVARVGDGDGIIFFNFRADRAREITRHLPKKGLTGLRARWFPTFAATPP
jgi:2,3-bisphosphoglycerate-independent phosphoglycerate mutase